LAGVGATELELTGVRFAGFELAEVEFAVGVVGNKLPKIEFAVAGFTGVELEGVVLEGVELEGVEEGVELAVALFPGIG